MNGPKKLGRLPNLGEKLWIEVECIGFTYGYEIVYAIVTIGTGNDARNVRISESDLGIDDEVTKKKIKLAELKAQVTELENDIFKSLAE